MTVQHKIKKLVASIEADSIEVTHHATYSPDTQWAVYARWFPRRQGETEEVVCLAVGPSIRSALAGSRVRVRRLLLTEAV